MARFLVTGGAGFIGSHLCDALLDAGHRVRVVDDLSTGRITNLDARVEFLRGDIADPVLMRNAMQGVSGCFHLAAIASVVRCNDSWSLAHRTNMGGTVCVFEAARDAGCVPVVYASSAAVYGTQVVMPINETAPCAPRSSYGADKFGAELQADAAFGVFGLPSLGLRFFNVYGPRQDPSSPYSGVISIFAQRLRDGAPLTIFGDGGQTRDFVYVGDIVRFLMGAMANLGTVPQARVLNACTGRATSVAELAQLMAAILGTQAVISHKPARAGDIRASIGDPLAAREVLGISADTTLESGLRRLFASQQEGRQAA